MWKRTEKNDEGHANPYTYCPNDPVLNKYFQYRFFKIYKVKKDNQIPMYEVFPLTQQGLYSIVSNHPVSGYSILLNNPIETRDILRAVRALACRMCVIAWHCMTQVENKKKKVNFQVMSKNKDFIRNNWYFTDTKIYFSFDLFFYYTSRKMTILFLRVYSISLLKLLA